MDYLKETADYIKHMSVLPIIASIGVDTRNSGGEINYPPQSVKACAFLYKRRFQTKPLQIGCQPTHIVVENIAAVMNLTAEYIDPVLGLKAGFFVHSSPKHYTAIAIFDRLSWPG